MTALRRVALGFPVTWSHRRPFAFGGNDQAGSGPYFVQWDPGSGTFGEDWTEAPRDAKGVLLTGRQHAYNPIRIAQFALHCFGIWHATGDESARAEFLAQAAWLRDRQQPRGIPGIYRFEFPWAKYGAEPGWWSAMAQGEAVSVLLRADRIVPGGGFADAALRAALPFRYDIAHGGVVWREGPDVFFEEIANEHAAHVLNGCIFALWGLWELRQQTREPWLDPLLEESVGTLRRWLHAFDTGWWTLYSLMRSAGGQPHVATLKYHAFHIAQMRVLAEMFDEPAFAQAAERWNAYVDSVECRAKLFAATMRSLPERALKRDTVAGGAHT